MAAGKLHPRHFTPPNQAAIPITTELCLGGLLRYPAEIRPDAPPGITAYAKNGEVLA